MRLIDFLLNLYPLSWRERYEDEFRALLEQSSLSPRVMLDIIGGAFDARLSPQYRSSTGDTMESKRLLQSAGGGALLCVLLMFGAVVNRTQQGWFDSGLMLLGMIFMVPMSIMVHLACVRRDARRSSRVFLLNVGWFGAIFMLYAILRQQFPQFIVAWQNIWIGSTFGLWIMSNSRLAYTTGLLSHWAMSSGLVAGASWFILLFVMLGLDMNLGSPFWLMSVFGIAALWLAVQLVWLSSLALAVFVPKSQQLAIND